MLNQEGKVCSLLSPQKLMKTLGSEGTNQENIKPSNSALITYELISVELTGKIRV